MDMQKLNLIFEKLKVMKKGEIAETICTCGGVMKIGKSSYNGHLRAACDGCGFKMMQ